MELRRRGDDAAQSKKFTEGLRLFVGNFNNKDLKKSAWMKTVSGNLL